MVMDGFGQTGVLLLLCGSMVGVLKTGFDNPVVWTSGPEEGKLQ
jgi:hypothetical protein